MSDNVQFQSTTLATPATGTTISTDEAASGHVQRIKITQSANGSDTPVQADASGLLVNTGAHLDAVHDPMQLSDLGIAVKAAIFGHATAQGGSYEPVKVTPSGALTVEVNDGGGSITVDQSGVWTFALPQNAATEFSLGVLSSNFASALSSSNLRVVESGLSLPISSSSAEVFSVSDQATNATLLDANASRKGWSIYNDSSAALYLKFGATASSTDFSVKVEPYGYYEQMGHGVYSGRVDGVWSLNSTGAARVSEW